MDKKPEPLVEYPDGGWGWCVCIATFVTQFIVLGTMNNFGVIYVELLREFKVGKAEAGKRNDRRKKYFCGQYRKQDANEMICLL